MGNSSHVARDVQLPSASHTASLQSHVTLSSTLTCCSAAYQSEPASSLVIISFHFIMHTVMVVPFYLAAEAVVSPGTINFGCFYFEPEKESVIKQS